MRKEQYRGQKTITKDPVSPKEKRLQAGPRPAHRNKLI